MQEKRPFVLSIAGLDPCAGAGVLADVKTFEALNTYGMAVITANTIQTQDQFISIAWQDSKEVVQGINTLLTAYPIEVIKIGIVKDYLFLEQILEAIYAVPKKVFIIWDPVLVSSSGYEFFPSKDLAFLAQIVSKIDLLTPNLPEYERLKPFLEDSKAILVKGGHRLSDKGVDVLHTAEKSIRFSAGSNPVYSKHGSGCVLSSAIAAYLALGLELEKACEKAKTYTEQFLKSNVTLLGYHYETDQ